MAPSPASPSHVRLPHGPKLPRRKRRARARRAETASQRENPRGETSRSRLLVRLFRGANRARVPAAVPPQFSTISPAHAGHARGAGLCPPVSDSCFLASIRFFLFFQNIRRRRVAVPYADLPPNDDAPSPLRDTYAVFQGMFAVIAPALMTGAFADRMMFTPYLIFIAGWVHLVYFPFCHSVWGGGFLAEWGVADFAGGIVVHISAGFSALAAVMAMPHRKKIEAELDTDPHNIPFVALGTAMLWFGWFGFNAGSSLEANTLAAYGAINTEISASCALFSWMIVEWLHKGKPTLVGACVGAIAGLATITPAAGFVRPWAAMIIGLLSAPWCYGLVEIVKDKLVIDDALDVFAVHGMGGFLGTLCIGIFADENVNEVKASGELFGKQFAAAVGTAVYAYAVGFALVKVIEKFMKIIPPQHALELGLDASIHGERAYKDTSQNGGKTAV